MNLTIVGFSQDVDLASPEEVQYFLKCQDASGTRHLFRIQKETMEDILKTVYGSAEESVEETLSEPEPVLGNGHTDEEDWEPEQYGSYFGGTPATEEEVPTI